MEITYVNQKEITLRESCERNMHHRRSNALELQKTLRMVCAPTHQRNY
jgi:hypothetical protein